MVVTATLAQWYFVAPDKSIMKQYERTCPHLGHSRPSAKGGGVVVRGVVETADPTQLATDL